MTESNEELEESNKFKESIIIVNEKEGYKIVIQSATKELRDLTEEALIIKTNFFNKHKKGRSYIG